jgi:hypothetical protein
MSKRITKTAPDVQLLQIGYSKFLFSISALNPERKKKGQFWLYTVHPLYGDALWNPRSCLFVLAKLPKKTKKEPFTGSFFSFSFMLQAKSKMNNRIYMVLNP